MTLPTNGQFGWSDDPREPVNNSAVSPQFFTRQQKTPNGTRTIEFVRFNIAGSKSAPEQRVVPWIERDYAAAYNAWKDGRSEAPVGTPLENWSALTPEQVRVLKSKNIFTVEAMADVPDGSISSLMGGPTLKKQAARFVEAQRNAKVLEQAEVREAQTVHVVNGLAAQLAEMEARMQAMADENARLKAGEQDGDGSDGEPARRGPGRPRKNPENLAV
jgi:hypothetical protein